MFDRIAHSTTINNADVQYDKLKTLYETIQPQMIAFEEAQLAFEKKTSQYITTCFSITTYNSLIPNDIPITRRNVLFSTKLGDRMYALLDVRAETTQAEEKFVETAMIKLDQIATLATATTANSAELVQNRIRMLEILDELVDGFLSQEQANIIARNIEHITSWAEIMEAIELHGWERQYQTYDYRDSTGLTLELSNGWEVFFI